MSKVVVVTGVSGGIGVPLARHLLERGYAVVGLSRRPPEGLEGRVRHYPVDLTDMDAVETVALQIRRDFPGVYGLIHNAGVAAMNHVLTMPRTDVERIFAVNAVAPVHLTRHLVRAMVRQGRGRIIGVSSVAVPWHLEGESVYAASKAALETFLHSIAGELAPYRITANAIGLPPLQTDLIRGVPPEKMDALLQRTAIRRYLRPEEIFPTVDFLMDPANDSLTGQTIYLGGP